MNTLGQLCLLVAFVGSGYAAFACVVGQQSGRRGIGLVGDLVAVTSVLALTAVTAVLVRALLVKDFSFAYVAEYSSRLLPWYYSLSALWVGQAGSLLLWAWFTGVLALAYRYWPRGRPSQLRSYAFGALMAYLCFLVATMVFAADPMARSLGTLEEGAGLSPLLQHPAMLIHPPIVFLGYAGWAIPFAIAVAALASGRLDADWAREARPWALFAWAVLGGGILWGALWAYEELGWGGYWAWDPVENGSLIPWLTGTALVHALMAWKYRGVFKKTALALAIATFGLCNFAAFLTRSGIFSSLHAFSESPIGWMFLLLVAALVPCGVILIVIRRSKLAPDGPVQSVWSREAFVLIATVALLLLATVALLGTLAVPISNLLLGRAIVPGAPFYNNVLVITGLLLLVTTGAAPLLRWGNPPEADRRMMLFLSAGGGAVATAIALLLGVRHPIALAVTWSAVLAALALIGALILDTTQRRSDKPRLGLLGMLPGPRRRYAGFLIHMGFVCLAVGVTGSSLATRRQDVVMDEGQVIEWAGRRIHFVELIQRELPRKLLAEAKLEISTHGDAGDTLLPAQHLHKTQDEWTSEVAVHATWGGDLYTILRGAHEDGSVDLTLVENPLMRWIWLGGWVMGAGALLGLCPVRAGSPRRAAGSPSCETTTSKGPASAPHRKRLGAQRHGVSG